MVFLQSGIDKAFSEKEARAGVGAPLPSRPRAQAPRASDALVQCEADIAAMRAASAAAQLLPRLSEDQRRAEAIGGLQGGGAQRRLSCAVPHEGKARFVPLPV